MDGELRQIELRTESDSIWKIQTVSPHIKERKSILKLETSFLNSEICSVNGVDVFDLWLLEWKEYFLFVPNHLGIQKVKLNDKVIEPAERLKEDNRNGYVVSFENQIGKSNLCFYDSNLKLLLRFDFEVVSEKISDEKNTQLFYPNFYQNLLLSLHNNLALLPFSIESQTDTHWGTVTGTKPTNDLFKLIFFRFRKSDIIASLSAIEYNPHKKISEELEFVRFDEVCSFNETSILSIVQYPENLVRTNNYHLIHEDGYVPSKILTEKNYDTFDTPENRFIKYFLQTLIQDIEHLIKEVVKTNNSDFISLKNEMEYFISSTFLREVGEMTIFPSYSTFLQRRYGYKELFVLYNEYLFSKQPFFENLNDAIDNRDVAKMYEYFCFFELAKLLDDNHSPVISIQPDSEDLEEGKTNARIKNKEHNFILTFNKTFSSERNESYSVNLRPDFTLSETRQTKPLAVFDAKFRLEFSTIEDARKNKDDNTIETTSKKADIYKMHTYKDALQIDYAVICYPGSREHLYLENHECLDDRDTIFQYIVEPAEKKFMGVGFLSLLPERK